jgi:hypothetical protein
MAENDEMVLEDDEGAAQETPKKKKKPNFSKPFIVSGVLLGVFAGAPVLNLGNYVFGLWGWIFGLFAAMMLSKQYKYFELAHGGMVGFFTGLIGSGIAMALDIGLCFANISTFTLVPALANVGKKLSFWIPPRFHDAIVLPPYKTLVEAVRIAKAANEQALPPEKVIAGHAFFMVPLLAGTAILGGIIGFYLFAKPAPKRQAGPPRRRRPAAAPKPEPTPEQASSAPEQPAPAEEESPAEDAGDSDKSE